MTIKNDEKTMSTCSTSGMGFARTGNTQIASENCELPARGFGTTDFGEKEEVTQVDTTPLDCGTAGMGFARTDKTEIAPENCAFPTKGFGTTDFGKNK
jgi:hypothetical protein